jgi:hypothetical protein
MYLCIMTIPNNWDKPIPIIIVNKCILNDDLWHRKGKNTLICHHPIKSLLISTYIARFSTVDNRGT